MPNKKYLSTTQSNNKLNTYFLTESRLNEQHITQYLTNNVSIVPISIKKAHILIQQYLDILWPDDCSLPLSSNDPAWYLCYINQFSAKDFKSP